MILVSPWSRVTTEGKPSPKNYPHWKTLIRDLKGLHQKVIQVSRKDEADIGAEERRDDLPLEDLYRLLKECATWISVDNFFHHMAWTRRVRGVVLFGPSDPEIFGHPENLNLLMDRRQLRTRQYGLWSQVDPRPEIFPPPGVVVAAVRSILVR